MKQNEGTNTMKTDYKVGALVYEADMYDGLNTSLADLEFYKKWLPQNKDAKILELCCGTGRLTIPIAKEGYNISGVDYTSSMLDRAKAKASQTGLKINFIEADIRTLDLQEKFDLIFLPFNSIHHLYKNEDLFETFKVVQNHLKEKGLFLLDCFNPTIQYIVEKERQQQVIGEYTTQDGKKVLIKQNMHYESATQINRIKWHYFIDGKFHSTQHMDMRLFFPQELDSYFKQAGFNVIHKFGDFTEEAFHNDSEKQIYVSALKNMHTDFTIRIAQLSDALELKSLFQNTVLHINKRDYSKEEVEDWASCGNDLSPIKEMIRTHYFIVATNRLSQIVGFSSITQQGYLHSMFIHKDFQGKGIATLLLHEIERYATTTGIIRITSEVSLTARPFFEKRGYIVEKEQKRKANMLSLTNFWMAKGLTK